MSTRRFVASLMLGLGVALVILVSLLFVNGEAFAQGNNTATPLPTETVYPTLTPYSAPVCPTRTSIIPTVSISTPDGTLEAEYAYCESVDFEGERCVHLMQTLTPQATATAVTATATPAYNGGATVTCGVGETGCEQVSPQSIKCFWEDGVATDACWFSASASPAVPVWYIYGGTVEIGNDSPWASDVDVRWSWFPPQDQPNNTFTLAGKGLNVTWHEYNPAQDHYSTISTGTHFFYPLLYESTDIYELWRNRDLWMYVTVYPMELTPTPQVTPTATANPDCDQYSDSTVDAGNPVAWFNP
ncbi:MAG: hypothetical protein H7836_15635, partial [Magnetococcus sp. YQC-3]